MSTQAEQLGIARLKYSGSSWWEQDESSTASSVGESGAFKQKRLRGHRESSDCGGQNPFAQEHPLFRTTLGDATDLGIPKEADNAQCLLEFRRSWESADPACIAIPKLARESLGAAPFLSARRTDSDGNVAEGPEGPDGEGGGRRAVDSSASHFATTTGNDHTKAERAEDCDSKGTPGGSIRGGSLMRPDNYSMFRTGSISRRSDGAASYVAAEGKPDDTGGPESELECVTDVSADRFFDSLQGPELELAKVSVAPLFP